MGSIKANLLTFNQSNCFGEGLKDSFCDGVRFQPEGQAMMVKDTKN